MAVGLSIISIILVGIIVWQYYLHTTRKAQLLNMQRELERIIDRKTNERLLYQTDQRELQLFLIQVNQLLDNNQKVTADYERAKLELSKMLANMSHDLKTPLTVILGYVEKLNMSERMTGEERHQLLSQLHQKTQDVIALMNQFFDLAKLESGDHFIALSRIRVNEVCRKSVLEYYEALQAKTLKIEVDIPEEPIYIFANEEALNRVLNNLISNAIRYGSDGRLFGLTVRNEKHHVSIDVWDAGKGIPEPDQKRVFERLYTLDDARHRAFQRSGLGLSITKQLVEVMRGTIHLRSVPYEKTVFTCTFKKIS